MTINSMFTTDATTATTNAKNLKGTTELTTIANKLVSEALQKLAADISRYESDFEASKVSHEAMDTFIAELLSLVEVDCGFLKELDDATIDSMLKSQQSKRSRAKSKAMTEDNYKILMSGAIAENLIRMNTGRSKQNAGARSTTAPFTVEELEELKADQEKVRKELRNVQSKKSILKAKSDFSEQDERWKTLMILEDQLKGIREASTRVKTVAVDTTKEALTELLAGIEIPTLKAAESKALLEQILGMVNQ